MCDFTVHPKNNYALQLHFEQVHTTDSPFVIKDDPEPLPPSLPPRPASSHTDAEDTSSSDSTDDSDDSDDSEQEERTVKCPEPGCGELVPLSDYNDHIDYHNAETLSFDENTPKYRSHHSSATMQSSSTSHRSHRRRAKSTSVEHHMSTDGSDALKKTEGRSRKPKKHGHRHRRDSNDSQKSTIGRSILGFNPFAKPDKAVKPPIKSARLGVSTPFFMAAIQLTSLEI